MKIKFYQYLASLFSFLSEWFDEQAYKLKPPSEEMINFQKIAQSKSGFIHTRKE